MSDTGNGNGKVVVNRAMSLDGFIAGPGHTMDWGAGRLADFVAPDDIAEIAAATGAMLVGRQTWAVGDSMEAEEPGSVDYPFSGPLPVPACQRKQPGLSYFRWFWIRLRARRIALPAGWPLVAAG